MRQQYAADPWAPGNPGLGWDLSNFWEWRKAVRQSAVLVMSPMTGRDIPTLVMSPTEAISEYLQITLREWTIRVWIEMVLCSAGRHPHMLRQRARKWAQSCEGGCGWVGNGPNKPGLTQAIMGGPVVEMVRCRARKLLHWLRRRASTKKERSPTVVTPNTAAELIDLPMPTVAGSVCGGTLKGNCEWQGV